MAVEFKTKFSNTTAKLIFDLFFKLAEEHGYEDKEKGLAFLKSKYSVEEINKWSEDFVVTLWEEERLIGFGRAKQNGWITHVYIDYPYEGKGLGSELLDKLEKHIADIGHKIVYLNSEKKALDFYKKKGYVVDGPTKIHEGIIQIPMRKFLEGSK